MDGVVLQVAVSCSLILDLLNHVFKISFWEDTSIILHIFLSVFISLIEHELETDQENSLSKNEIFLRVVFTSCWVSLFLSLHESTTNSSRVLIANLINLDGIITAVE